MRIKDGKKLLVVVKDNSTTMFLDGKEIEDIITSRIKKIKDGSYSIMIAQRHLKVKERDYNYLLLDRTEIHNQFYVESVELEMDRDMDREKSEN
jgi:hypothetical protein